MIVRTLAIAIAAVAVMDGVFLTDVGTSKPIETPLSSSLPSSPERATTQTDISAKRDRAARALSVAQRAEAEPIRLMMSPPATVQYETANRSNSVRFSSSSPVRMWTTAEFD